MKLEDKNGDNLNTIQKIAKNTGILILADIISKLFGFLFIVYVARHLGAEGFGILSFAIAFTGIFGVLVDLGLSTLTVREVAKDKSLARKYLGNVVTIKIIFTTITIGLIILTINLLDYPEQTIKVVYLVSLSVIFGAFTGMFNSIFQAFERMEYNSIGMVLNSILLLSGALFAIRQGYGVIGFASIYLLASIIVMGYSFVICIRKFVTPKLEINWAFWKGMIKKALPIMIGTILMVFYTRIDIVMLSLMKGDEAVGWYDAAWRFVGMFMSIPAIYMMAIFPVMSSFYNSSHNSLEILYQRSFRYLFMLALPIGVGVTILAERLIFLIFGSEFVSSIQVLQILAWVLIFSFPIGLLGYLLVAIDRIELNALSAGIGVLVNISLNLILIPLFSYVGASVSTLIAQLTLFIALYYFLSKNSCTIPLNTAVKPLIAGLFMGIFIYLLRDINLILVLVSAPSLYFFLLYIFRAITAEDISLVKQVFRGVER